MAKLTTPSPAEIRDAILRVERSELIARGVTNPNVTRGSDSWVKAEAVAQQIVPVYANQQDSLERMMPDTAEDDDLIRICDIFGVGPQVAAGSAGNIVLNSSASTFVAVDIQLIDPAGQFWKVSAGATYANGASIPVIPVSAGASTNVPQGTVLQWIVPPTFAAATALVGVGGLIGGTDADTNESLRNRLFTLFRNPPGAGNWSHVAKLCTDASPSVQAGYVYPAINGPGTVGVCVVGSLSFDVTNGWSREVSSTVLATVTAYLGSHLPESLVTGAGLVCVTPTGSANVDCDVALGISIPLPTHGGGAGGGWTDALPWPDLLGTATKVTVSAVSSASIFTLTSTDATTTPSTAGLVLGQTQVAWFSSSEYAAGNDPIKTAVVTNVSGSTGSLQITVSTPFTGIAVGDHVFPNAEHVQDYARAFLVAMNNMGPGQWTAHAPTLVRAKRRPLVTVSNTSDFSAPILRAITDAGEEVQDTQYLFRALTNPTVPVNTTTASPLIFVPRRFSFYNRLP